MQAERIKDKSREVKHVKIGDQAANVYAIAFRPPIGWSTSERLDYVEGAKLIADECRGVSDFLDQKFEETYKAAIRELK